MKGQNVKVDGLRELQTALQQLPQATAKGVLRRVLARRAQPIADAAKALAPVETGDLKDSITVSTKRPKGQKTAAAVAFARTRAMGGSIGDAKAASRAAGSSAVEVFVGPGRNPQAIMQEFGTSRHGPQPYLRPAWDRGKDAALDGIGADLWDEIRKTAERAAKRAPGKAARGT